MAQLPMLLVEDFFQRTDLTGHIVTDPAASAGFPASRLGDRKDYLQYKAPAGAPATLTRKVDLGVGNALEANAFAMVNHTGATMAQPVVVAYSDNDADWTDVFSTTPAQDTLFLRTFDGAGVHRYWREQYTLADDTLLIGENWLGRRIEFPQSVDPPQGFDPLADKPVLRSSRSQEGFVLESTFEYAERSYDWRFRGLPNSFVGDTTEWTGLRWWWENYGSKGKSVVAHWNPSIVGGSTTFQHDGIYGLVEGSLPRPLATSVDTGLRDVTLRISGRRDD